MSEQKQVKLVNSIFDSWNRGETSNDLAIRQLTRIAEVTSHAEVRELANASLETVKVNG
jgi:hypothetical protein